MQTVGFGFMTAERNKPTTTTQSQTILAAIYLSLARTMLSCCPLPQMFCCGMSQAVRCTDWSGATYLNKTILPPRIRVDYHYQLRTDIFRYEICSNKIMHFRIKADA
jgi:hypothetical protein